MNDSLFLSPLDAQASSTLSGSTLSVSLVPMGGDVNIDIDGSMFIQLAVFLVVMVLLTRMVFRPFLASIDARDQRTVTARQQAKDIDARATALEARHRELLSQARTQAAEVRQTLRGAGLATKDAEVGGARKSAEAVIEDARARAAAQYEAGRVQLLGEVDALSRLVVEKVIGRGV